MKRLQQAGRALTVACSFLVSPALAQAPSDADLQALRFYLSEENEQAVNSELRRLQLQYPDWVVPEDLGQLEQGVPGERIDSIYRQIAAGEFAEARASIESLSRTYPSWTPSPELLATLATGEDQANFEAAVEAGNAQVAIRIARENPALLRCERVNNAWLLAEQYEATGAADAAIGVYTGIARSCVDPDILVATLEKSAATASLEQLGQIADLARGQSPATAERLTAVEERLRAGILAARNASAPTEGAPAAQTALPAGVAPDVSLRPISRGQAAPKPRPATGSAPKAPAAAPAAPGAAVAAAQRGDWAGCLARTANARSAAGVAQRGWCALNADRPMQALADFTEAAQRGGSASARRDARYGQAITMLELDMIDQAAAIAAATHFTAEQRLEIESLILDKRGVAAYERRDYASAIAYFDELERITGVVRRDLAILRGYAYLNSGQRARAKEEFQRLHDQFATQATKRALSDALR
ncbi:hypothetical protein SAMN06297129_1783 [Pseudooceanicola antarcticus]|uniref:Tetratricopeptide repeat-containing protein n=1 Tax=Pseudooceanicola antarcticus TaxID=1247613 RepID=A0A285IQQ0_9RHOB|nr:hypothetical protein [Pseudooceanicola antarcticus]PJE31758.1 hypothetical protein CVM39_01245 [Pseudooceanicola antarcticus]SNY50350.1 hypothetical protein SAMN06297129_1783 [Pseudooceanicola antarcticus]